MFGSMRLFRKASKTERKRVRGLCSPRLTLETLETRELLAGGLSASLSFGVLTVQDPTPGDTIRIRQTNNQVSVDGISILTAGGMAATVNASQVSRMAIAAQGGNDLVDVNSGVVNGQQPLVDPIAVTVGQGNDTIDFRGLSPFVDAPGEVLGLDPSDSALYDLEANNQLYRLDVATGQNSLLSSVVQSYVIASDSSLYGQNTDQSMWRYYDGALYDVDSSVAGYLVMPDSSAYYYKTNGGLWLQFSDGNYLPQLDPQTISMQLTANGGIVALQRDGLLGSYFGGVFTSLDTGVQFYRAGADGTIYYEKQDGSLWSTTGTGTKTQLALPQYSMYADDTVYQLQDGLLESLGSDGIWRQTANNVIQAVIGPDTQGVVSTFWLTSNDGQVARANAAGFSWFSAGVSQLLVGPDDHGVLSTLALLSDGQVEAWNGPYYNHYVTPADVQVSNLRLLWSGVAGDIPNGTIYWSATSGGTVQYTLTSDRKFSQTLGSGPATQVDSGVQSYEIAADGSVYYSTGTLWHLYNPTHYVQVDGNVVSYRLADASTLPGQQPGYQLYYLKQDGSVGGVINDTGTYLPAVDETNNVSYAMAADGTVYVAQIVKGAWGIWVLGADGVWFQTSDRFQKETVETNPSGVQSRILTTTDNRVASFNINGFTWLTGSANPQDADYAGAVLLSTILDSSLQPTNNNPDGTLEIQVGSFLRAELTVEGMGTAGTGWTFTFTNVQLNVGLFAGSILGSMIASMQKVTSPLNGIAQFLEGDLPVISDLEKLAGGDGITLEQMPLTGNTTIDPFAEAIIAINQLALPSSDQGWINVGSFTAAWNGAGSPLNIINSQSEALLPQQGQPGQIVGPFLSYIQQKLQNNQLQVNLPVLDDPSTLFGVIAGERVTLFTYTLPPLDADWDSGRWDIFDDIPVAPPLPLFFSAYASVDVHLHGAGTFGFDSSGILAGNVAAGFFAENTSLMASVTFLVAGEFSLGPSEPYLSAISATLSGKLTLSDTATLEGPNGANIVYGDQLLSGVAQLIAPVNLSGTVTGAVSFYAPSAIYDAVANRDALLDAALQILADAQQQYNDAQDIIQHPENALSDIADIISQAENELANAEQILTPSEQTYTWFSKSWSL